MSDERERHPRPEPDLDPLEATPVRGDGEAWKTVYFGQVSQELVPFHPEPPEAAEDDLTRAALEDTRDPGQDERLENAPPTLWRLVTVVMVAVIALAIVFWR